jgi:hypothetical protein
MPKKAKAPNQADTKGKGWIGLPKVVAMSHAYRTLSYPARATLIEIMFYFNGHNNGKIGISQRQIMEALGTSSPHTVIDAIIELIDHGLIEVTVEGEWRPRMARQYRLTFVSTMQGILPVRATNDYLQFDGDRKREQTKRRKILPCCDSTR